jgi:putative ABC transport system substrate-binding protein
LVRCLVLGLGDGIGRREFITLIGGAAAWPISARAQPTTKIPRIGVLSPGGSDKSDASLTTINAFIPVLRELGYTEGQNIAIERKFAGGNADRLRSLATELVERQVDFIVAFSTPGATAVYLQKILNGAKPAELPVQLTD